MLNIMKTFFTILSCFTLHIASHTFKTHHLVNNKIQMHSTSDQNTNNQNISQNILGLQILRQLLQKQNIDQCVKEYADNTVTFKMGFFNLSTSEQKVINNWLVYAGYIPLPNTNIELARLPEQSLLFTDALYSYIKTQESADRKVWLHHISEFVKISLQQQKSCLHALFPEYILAGIEEIAAEIYESTTSGQIDSNTNNIIEVLPIELKMHIKRALHCIRISKTIKQGISYISSGLQLAIQPFQHTISKLSLIPQGLKDLNTIFSSRYEVQKLVRSFLGQPN